MLQYPLHASFTYLDYGTHHMSSTSGTLQRVDQGDACLYTLTQEWILSGMGRDFHSLRILCRHCNSLHGFLLAGVIWSYALQRAWHTWLPACLVQRVPVSAELWFDISWGCYQVLQPVSFHKPVCWGLLHKPGQLCRELGLVFCCVD
jgi:hypothetical protein